MTTLHSIALTRCKNFAKPFLHRGALLLLALAACGDELNLQQTLRIDITGSRAVPEGATGNATPISADVTVQQISFTNSETAIDTTFLNEAKILRVVNQPLKLIEIDVPKDWIGQTFNPLKVTLGSSMTIKSIYGTGTVTLEKTEVVYAQNLAISKGKDVTLSLDIKWGNTIERDESADPPTDVLKEPGVELNLK
jgi:hypothetical protein